MTAAARIAIATTAGAVITFALLVLMFSLIATGNQAVNEHKARKIADFLQPERQLTQYVRPVKPERPAATEATPPTLPAVREQLDAGPADAISLFAQPNLRDSLSVGLGGGDNRDSDYIPVYVPQPSYPPGAQSEGVSGYAVVRLTVTTSGAIRDPVLVEEHPAHYGFGAAAVKAAYKLKYNPRVVNGQPREVSGVTYKFTFQIE